MSKRYLVLILLLFHSCTATYVYAASIWYGKSVLVQKEYYDSYDVVVLYLRADNSTLYHCSMKTSNDVFDIGHQFETVNVKRGHCELLVESQNNKYLPLLYGLSGLMSGCLVCFMWAKMF